MQYSRRSQNEICVPETRENISNLQCMFYSYLVPGFCSKDFSLSRFLKTLPNIINKTVNVLCSDPTAVKQSNNYHPDT